MKILVNEKLSSHKYKTPEGYLICTDAILARTGKQDYLRRELFGDSCENPDETVWVDRKPEEVFDEATLSSFENKPITVDHPDENVNPSNYRDLAVGYVRDVRRDKMDDGTEVIKGNLVITDEQTINEILEGEHTDLSCGYDCEILDEDNPQQRRIRGNHVALCEEGRAGVARIVDSKDVNDNKKVENRYHKKNRIGDTIKGSHEKIMGAIYENDYDLPSFDNTIDLIEKLWSKNYSEYDGWDEFEFNKQELNQIYESAKKEALEWDNMDVYNSHARYRDTDDINRDLKSLFGIKNTKIHDSKVKDMAHFDMSEDDWDEITNNGDDESWIVNHYDISIKKEWGRVKVAATGSRTDLEKFYKDYHLRDYNVKIIDSKTNDSDKRTIKNTGLAYEVWNGGKFIKKFPTKRLAIDWIQDRFPGDKIVEDSRDYIIKDSYIEISKDEIDDEEELEIDCSNLRLECNNQGKYYQIRGEKKNIWKLLSMYNMNEKKKYIEDSKKKMSMNDALNMISIIKKIKK